MGLKKDQDVKDLKAISHPCIRKSLGTAVQVGPERGEDLFPLFQKKKRKESTPSLKCSSKVGLMPSCCPGNKALSGKQWGDWCFPIGCLV